MSQYYMGQDKNKEIKWSIPTLLIPHGKKAIGNTNKLKVNNMIRINKLLLTATFFGYMTSVVAQIGKETKLPVPDFNRNMTTVMKALAERKSVRVCSGKELENQDLSDILWAANGINRKDGKRTAPSSLNAQDITIYAFTVKGVYLYQPETHSLKTIVVGDYRNILAGPPSPARSQEYVVKFPLILLYVSDLSRIKSTGEQARLTAAMDVAFVSENVNLFCAGAGLSTVTRASMERSNIVKLLNLKENQLPLLNNAVGYPKE